MGPLILVVAGSLIALACFLLGLWWLYRRKYIMGTVTLVVGAAAALGTLVAFLAISFLSGVIDEACERSHKYRHLETIDLAQDPLCIALYASQHGLGDPTWRIFLIPDSVGHDPAKEIPRPLTRQWQERTIFETYSEVGVHADSARLELIGLGIVLLERGGLYHAAIDLVERKVLVGDRNPWFQFTETPSRPVGFDGLEWEQQVKLYTEWKRRRYHEPIRIMKERAP